MRGEEWPLGASQPDAGSVLTRAQHAFSVVIPAQAGDDDGGDTSLSTPIPTDRRAKFAWRQFA